MNQKLVVFSSQLSERATRTRTNVEQDLIVHWELIGSLWFAIAVISCEWQCPTRTRKQVTREEKRARGRKSL